MRGAAGEAGVALSAQPRLRSADGTLWSVPRAGAAPCWPERGYTRGHTLVGGAIAAGRGGKGPCHDLCSLDRRKLTRRPHNWSVARSGPGPKFRFL